MPTITQFEEAAGLQKMLDTYRSKVAEQNDKLVQLADRIIELERANAQLHDKLAAADMLAIGLGSKLAAEERARIAANQMVTELRRHIDRLETDYPTLPEFGENELTFRNVKVELVNDLVFDDRSLLQKRWTTWLRTLLPWRAAA